MKTKTKVVRFRVTEDQYFVMKKACGDNMSKWILENLHYSSEDWDKVSLSLRNEDALPKKGDVSHVVGEFKPKEIVPQISTVMPIKNIKCSSPYCFSTDTKKYERSTGTFWLCDTHKP